jgi:chromosome segregation ATPase
VFDDLQNRYEALEAQADALQGQIADADGAYQTAGALADRLFEEIQSLRRQGRDDESNALVDQQNAAADQANALVEQYNGLVDQYNAVVAELNTLATALNESYNAISPTPIPLPTDQ